MATAATSGSGGAPPVAGTGARRIAALVAAIAVAIAAILAATPPPAAAGHAPTPPGALPEPALPVVFVHGGSGSAAQYETQALRWASNGYPNVVTAIDRLSSVGATFFPQLDAFIDDVLATTGDEQVYILAHSLGTALMVGYLNSSPERAARVAKYVNIDGATSPVCPGGQDENDQPLVPCMGIWGRGNPARMMGTAHNIQFADQGHTQSVTSPESFVAQYRFLTGQEPKTSMVLPEPPGEVTIAGRALNFPANTGIAGATVQLWKVNPATGARTTDEPLAETVVDASGDFGPWPVNGLHRYEISVIRQIPETADVTTQHFYYEPWIRDNHMIRLNLAPVGSVLSNAIERGPHTTVSLVRQKEWWGANDVDATNVDSLVVATSRPSGGQLPVEIINANTAPYNQSTIAIIGFDVDVDQTTDVSQLRTLQIFINAIDIYMPASDPTDGVITFDHQQRRTSAPQVINTPNWESAARHGMTVTFREWVQDVDSWRACKSARPSPCA
jgi:hypothetical protein